MRFDDRDASETEAIKTALRAFSNKLHTCMPGTITKWDKATQLADVQPILQRTYLDSEGNTVYEKFPTIPNVRVQFPRAGGHAMTFPVAVGDKCLLIFCESSIDKYQTVGGTDVADPIQRRHELDDAFALLGGWPDADNLAIVEADATVIGPITGTNARIYVKGDEIALGEKTPAEYVALATKTFNEITALRNVVNTFVTIFNSHIHPTPSGPSSPTTTPASAPSAVGSVAATKVKAK